MPTTLTVSDRVAKNLKRLISGKPEITERKNNGEQIVLSKTLFQSLVSLLEDIEDLRDARRAEKDFLAGKGKPFQDYDRKRKTRIQSHHPKPKG